jgi:C4-dicarboxylate transporter, DctM subunit
VSDLAVGLSCLGATIFLIALRVPIGLALGGVAILGMLDTAGPQATMATVKSLPFEFAANWELSAIPMFILMGAIAYQSGMTSSLFHAARVWLGRLPGGLAVASNMACAGFAAASGSSLATTVAMGRIAVPEMRKYGYDPGLATGVVAAAGTLGSLIPPSILLVIYGIFAETSIPNLFIAGIIPGILTAVVYAGMIVTRCTLDPTLAPKPDEAASTKEKLRVLAEIWPLPMLILGVLGGIYSGYATATEAGALGVVLSLAIAAARRTLSLKVLLDGLRESVHSTAAIFFIALGAMLMTRLMAYSGVPQFLAEVMGVWAVNPVLLIIATAVLYLVLGCFIDPIGMVLLTLPVLLPMFRAAHLDLVWFGILVVKFVEIGLITPPVGLNVFAVRSIAPDVPVGAIFRGTIWFLGCELFVLLLLILFPGIALFLVD